MMVTMKVRAKIHLQAAFVGQKWPQVTFSEGKKRLHFIGMPFPVWALCTQFEESQTYTLAAMTLINLVMPWPSLLTLTLAQSLAWLCFFSITFQDEKSGLQGRGLEAHGQKPRRRRLLSALLKSASEKF